MAESSKQSTKKRKTARQKAVEKNSREIAELTKKHGVNNGRQSDKVWNTPPAKAGIRTQDVVISEMRKAHPN